MKMNILEEIQEITQKYLDIKSKFVNQIIEIENKRTELSIERNQQKYEIQNNNESEINELGRKITQLGIESQELQNRLDSEYINIKNTISSKVDNFITEKIREVKKIEELNDDVQEGIEKYENNQKKRYEQVQEFYKKFGREPDISKTLQKQIDIENRKYECNKDELERNNEKLKFIEQCLSELVFCKEAIKNKNIENILKPKARIIEQAIEIQKEENIDEISCDDIEEISEINIVEMESIIEREENIKILNIVVKAREGKIVYKAEINNGDTLVIYSDGKKLNNYLNDNVRRDQIAKELVKYSGANYKKIDKRAIKKIDPSICELYFEFAKEYNQNYKELVYNYAMSFSNIVGFEEEKVPEITYAISYIENEKIAEKEQKRIKKVCKNAIKNMKINVIGYNDNIKKIKYILMKIFNINNNILQEGNANNK